MSRLGWFVHPYDCRNLHLWSSGGKVLSFRRLRFTSPETDSNNTIWVDVHPGRLTAWTWKWMVWKMIFLYNWVIFRFHVNLPGCISYWKWWFSQPAMVVFFWGGVLGEGVLFSTWRRLVHRWPFSQVQVLQEHVKSNIVKESHGTSWGKNEGGILWWLKKAFYT